MKNVKRLLALFLGTALIFSTACQSKPTESDYEWVEYTEVVSGKEKTTKTKSDTDKTDAAGETSVQKDADGGKNTTTAKTTSGKATPTIVRPSGNSSTIDTSKFKGKHLRIMYGYDKSDKSDIVQGHYAGLDSWMKRYGSTYEIVNPGAGYTNLQAAIAAGESPDLFYQVGSFPDIVSVGLVQPIENYIPSDQKYISQQSINEAAWGGHIYSIFSSEGVGRTYLGFNPDLFVERGQKTPKQYYEEGNWTWDTFRQVAKAMTGNGLFGCYARNFAYFGSENIVSVAANGALTSTLNSKNTSDFLQWYYQLANVDKIFAVDANQKAAMGLLQVDAEPMYNSKGRL